MYQNAKRRLKKSVTDFHIQAPNHGEHCFGPTYVLFGAGAGFAIAGVDARTLTWSVCVTDGSDPYAAVTART
jgi:hypothetical protein